MVTGWQDSEDDHTAAPGDHQAINTAVLKPRESPRDHPGLVTRFKDLANSHVGRSTGKGSEKHSGLQAMREVYTVYTPEIHRVYTVAAFQLHRGNGGGS